MTTTAKKRMGRPPIAKKERKAVHVSVRVTADEYRGFERAAKAAELGLSEWARAALLVAAG